MSRKHVDVFRGGRREGERAGGRAVREGRQREEGERFRRGREGRREVRRTEGAWSQVRWRAVGRNREMSKERICIWMD